MTDSTVAGGTDIAGAPSRRSLRSALEALELDGRLVALVIGLGMLWLIFDVLSGGLFLSARNLWNLSVQSTAVAIMATGMVLVIVSRNIDLSIGSIVVFVGMAMGLLQTRLIPDTFGLGLEQPYTWIVVVIVGLVLGATIGGIQGFIVGYVGVPSFIVTLGGLLFWRGLAFQLASGETLAPLDPTFQLLGGGPRGSLGENPSWLVALLAIIAIVGSVVAGRRRRRRYGLSVRPAWADATLAIVGCGAVVGAVAIANSYPWPATLAEQFGLEHGIPIPPGGLVIGTGIAMPVLLMVAIASVMTVLATRRRLGRYIYAYGGNPEAAELAGINTRWTVMRTFMIMGVLAALAAVVISARLNAATQGLGAGVELQVIAAAVIGGTSLAGGIGTIPGAVLGAFVMQSLQSGLVLLKVDSAAQDMALGLVLVGAVMLDTALRRRRGGGA